MIKNYFFTSQELNLSDFVKHKARRSELVMLSKEIVKILSSLNFFGTLHHYLLF